MTGCRGAALVGSCLTLLAGAGVAQGAGAPPPGQPDPATMVVQRSDLAPGARVVTQGYQTPKPGILSTYRRNFSRAVAHNGVRLIGVFSLVFITQNAQVAHAGFVGGAAEYDSPKARDKLAKAIAPHVRRRNVHFGPVRGLGVGDESSLVAITIHARGQRITIELTTLRVNQGVAVLEVDSHRGDPHQAAAIGLAAAVASHMRAGLG